MVGELAESKATLYCQYGLIAGQHLLTLVTRIGLPYFVAFLSVEAGLTDQQRSTLLSSFTAGYVTMQIPGGYLAQSIGNKAVCLINNLSVAALLSTLPLIARAGVPGLAPALALVGVLQGPLMISTGSLSTFWLPPPSSTERPWAMLAVRMGSHLSKVIGPALTPWLISRAGWRAAARIYGCAFAMYAVLWSAFARERPQTLANVSFGHTSGANHDMPKSTTSSPPPFTMRLLTVRAEMAIMFSQVCHDLLEFQTLASYAPVYFAEVLGVPLRRVGMYTVWPMVFGMAGKVGVTIFETALLKRQVSRLTVRKLSNTIASLSVMLCTLGFSLVRSPVVACALYCGASIGHCFDYPGFVANHVEVQGPDVGVFAAYSNTVNWVFVFIFGQIFAILKRVTGSWQALFLGPVVLRGLNCVWYLHYASVDSARSHLERRQRQN